MRPYAWKLLLVASLLVNAGLIASAWLPGWRANGASERALFGMRHEEVADRLELDPGQRERWHEMEAGFVDALRQSGQEIRIHRERLVREIMSARPDSVAIERERGAIFALQEKQQRDVIAQLLKEREMLRPDQRDRLAELLLGQDRSMQGGR